MILDATSYTLHRFDCAPAATVALAIIKSEYHQRTILTSESVPHKAVDCLSFTKGKSLGIVVAFFAIRRGRGGKEDPKIRVYRLAPFTVYKKNQFPRARALAA